MVRVPYLNGIKCLLLSRRLWALKKLIVIQVKRRELQQKVNICFDHEPLHSSLFEITEYLYRQIILPVPH